MDNLGLLKRVCRAVSIEIPATLTALTLEQEQILREISAKHREICASRRWWFLQRVGDFNTLGYASGSSCTVTGTTTRTVTINGGATPFHATLSANGKMSIVSESGETGYNSDIVRVNYASTSTATVASTFARTNPSAKAWWYGQDEYAVASDCDEIAWMMLWRQGATGTAIVHRLLQGISYEEMESNRRNRTTFFYQGQPTDYCLVKHGTTVDHTRYVILDPFPEVAEHVCYGYYKQAAELFSTGSVPPDLPEKHQEVLVDAGILYYLSTYGMGAPAGSPAGQDVQARLVEVQKDYVEGMQALLQDQRIAQELPSFDPSSVGRIAFHDALGRSI